MANLKYADLGKRNNRFKFIDKVFGRKGDDGGTNENNWNTDKGLFYHSFALQRIKEKDFNRKF